MHYYGQIFELTVPVEHGHIDTAALAAQLDQALARATVRIRASCFCRSGAKAA